MLTLEFQRFPAEIMETTFRSRFRLRFSNRRNRARSYYYIVYTLCTPRQHPPLTNLITHPLCFFTAFCSDVTSQLFSWERGGAQDVKKIQTLTIIILIKVIQIRTHLVNTSFSSRWIQGIKKPTTCRTLKRVLHLPPQINEVCSFETILDSNNALCLLHCNTELVYDPNNKKCAL